MDRQQEAHRLSLPDLRSHFPPHFDSEINSDPAGPGYHYETQSFQHPIHYHTLVPSHHHHQQQQQLNSSSTIVHPDLPQTTVTSPDQQFTSNRTPLVQDGFWTQQSRSHLASNTPVPPPPPLEETQLYPYYQNTSFIQPDPYHYHLSAAPTATSFATPQALSSLQASSLQYGLPAAVATPTREERGGEGRQEGWGAPNLHHVPNRRPPSSHSPLVVGRRGSVPNLYYGHHQAHSLLSRTQLDQIELGSRVTTPSATFSDLIAAPVPGAATKKRKISPTQELEEMGDNASDYSSSSLAPVFENSRSHPSFHGGLEFQQQQQQRGEEHIINTRGADNNFESPTDRSKKLRLEEAAVTIKSEETPSPSGLPGGHHLSRDVGGLTIDDSRRRFQRDQGALNYNGSWGKRQTNETRVICYHANVGQKSYGSERRLLCPPPMVRILSPYFSNNNKHSSDNTPSTSSNNNDPSTSNPSNPQINWQSQHLGRFQSSQAGEGEPHLSIRIVTETGEQQAAQRTAVSSLPHRLASIGKQRRPGVEDSGFLIGDGNQEENDDMREEVVAYFKTLFIQNTAKQKSFRLLLGIHAPHPTSVTSHSHSSHSLRRASSLSKSNNNNNNPPNRNDSSSHLPRGLSSNPPPSVQPSVDIPLSPPFALMASNPTMILSKPSKKTSKARSTQSCILDGSLISLYSRVNAQTVRTKLMTVEPVIKRKLNELETHHHPSQSLKMVARSGRWTPFRIDVVKRYQAPTSDPTSSINPSSTSTDNFDTSAAIEEKLRPTVTYGSHITLTDPCTGYVSPRLLVRQRQSANDRVIVTDEDCGGPVSQLQKLCFQEVAVRDHHDDYHSSSTSTSTSTSLKNSKSLKPEVHKRRYWSAPKEVYIPGTGTEKDNDFGEEATIDTVLSFKSPELTPSEEIDVVADVAAWTVIGVTSFSYSFLDRNRSETGSGDTMMDRKPTNEASSSSPSPSSSFSNSLPVPINGSKFPRMLEGYHHDPVRQTIEMTLCDLIEDINPTFSTTLHWDFYLGNCGPFLMTITPISTNAAAGDHHHSSSLSTSFQPDTAFSHSTSNSRTLRPMGPGFANLYLRSKNLNPSTTSGIGISNFVNHNGSEASSSTPSQILSFVTVDMPNEMLGKALELESEGFGIETGTGTGNGTSILPMILRNTTNRVGVVLGHLIVG